ncbi:MAG: histidine kinase, partial [Ferruginibacter sp.]|nr:histidine kinase [Ferruginibacter sp.]
IGSNNGIYKIDETGKILDHFTKQNGLPDDCIYAMLFDDAGTLWCSSNKGIFRMGKDKNIFLLRKEDGLQENEFNTNVAAKADDGEMYFGGVNGISSFYPASINNIKDSVGLFFTQIKINNKEYFTDTAAWNITNIDLPYYQNLLSFDFVAMGNNNPDQYVYQYKMDDIDEQWLQNEDLQTVRYFLPPGKYVFKIFASRFFDKDAKPTKEIRITIHAPFYKRWWFFGLIAFLFVGTTIYAINRLNKTKYRKKLTVLENEHKIQLERERISRDLHDSLGAYANAVLYKTELLQKEEGIAERNDLMSDLKFASKDIITSLRETVWALKKDNYTAEECMLRIKNFIQPLSKYYGAIHFTVDAEDIDKTLVHSKALNVVRIVQEAVTNGIKHAAAKNIIIKSIIDNNQWKITVTDDGKGFDYERMINDGQGNGLDNLKQRALDADIKLRIDSLKNAGTTVTLII